METITYTLIAREDLDLGAGVREVRLQNNAVVVLHQIHVGTLLLTVTARCAPAAGVASVSVPLIPAGARVFGVTAQVLTSLGTSQGLSAWSLGDATLEDRWGSTLSCGAPTQTSQAHFASGDCPIYADATPVLVTAQGGLCDGTGLLELTAHYLFLTHVSA